jgi:hypothetical protein
VNGPEHYRAAEQLLARIGGRIQAPAVDGGIPITAPNLANVIACAEAHTRLAGVAALIAARGGGMTDEDEKHWAEVLGGPNRD